MEKNTYGQEKNNIPNRNFIHNNNTISINTVFIQTRTKLKPTSHNNNNSNNDDRNSHNIPSLI